MHIKIMNQKRISLKPFLTTAVLAVLAVLATAGGTAAESDASGDGKKLLVFILAGQSNMQGHAEVSTLAYLPKPAHVPTEEEWRMMTASLEGEIKRDREKSISEELLKDPANRPAASATNSPPPCSDSWAKNERASCSAKIMGRIGVAFADALVPVS